MNSPTCLAAAERHEEVLVEIGMPTNLPEVIALAASMHAQSSYRDLHFDEAKVVHLLSHLMENPAAIVFVAREDGRLVGAFAGMVAPTWFGQDLIGIDFAFFVSPTAHDPMTAATLLLTFESWCERRGARYIRLGSAMGIQIDNASHLYRTLGFESSVPSFMKQVGHAKH